MHRYLRMKKSIQTEHKILMQVLTSGQTDKMDGQMNGQKDENYMHLTNFTCHIIIRATPSRKFVLKICADPAQPLKLHRLTRVSSFHNLVFGTHGMPRQTRKTTSRLHQLFLMMLNFMGTSCFSTNCSKGKNFSDYLFAVC